MKYLCLCDPTANVAIEVLCGLVRGKTLGDVASIKVESILERVGSDGDELRTRATALIEFVNKGITRYKNLTKNGSSSLR
jgi:hypothetical protein